MNMLLTVSWTPVRSREELPFTSPAEVEFRFENDHERFRHFNTKANAANNAQPQANLLIRTVCSCATNHSVTSTRNGISGAVGCGRPGRVREKIMEEGTSIFTRGLGGAPPAGGTGNQPFRAFFARAFP
jgi:hypothetical protein